jgi:hypothetical protein
MQELIIKQDISPSKMDALIQFLKGWDIEVELKRDPKKPISKKHTFTLSAGLLKDNNIDAKDLRAKAWKINQLFPIS